MAAEVANIRASISPFDAMERKTQIYADAIAHGNLSEYSEGLLWGHVLARLDSLESSMAELFRDRV